MGWRVQLCHSELIKSQSWNLSEPERMNHRLAQMDDLGLNSVLQPIMGTLGKSISFYFTGKMIVPDSVLPKLHRDLVKIQIQ